jgi:PTS system nitrogen regulatory IIA component
VNLTLRDVAKMLNVSERTIYRWLELENIPAYRVHDQYRFNRAELLAWATARRIKVSDQLFQEPETSGISPPRFSDTLAAGGIFYRVDGRDRAAALRAAVELVKLPDDVDRDWVFKMLLARESLGSTGVGEGIAIPHVRYPIALHTPRPLLTLCFLENPVDFGALDGQPVRILFVLLSPTIRGHLSLLSKVGFALRDLGFRGAVLREGSREEILREAKRVEAALTEAIASAPPTPMESG